MKKIATLTLNPCIDLSCHVDVVEHEHKLRTDQPHRDPGGGGINVSRAIAKLGGHSRAHYLAGGHTGDLLGDLLEADRLDHCPVRIAGLTRENVTVNERSTNRQYRFVMPGPAVDVDDLDRCLNEIFTSGAVPDYLCISGSSPTQAPDNLQALAAQRAAAHNCRVVLDASGRGFALALQQGVFLIKPNQRELGLMVGEQLTDRDAIAAAAQHIAASGKVQVVVVSMGADGALVAAENLLEHIPSPKVPVSSRVGAGDSTVAGITLGLARGLSIGEAARFGIACGAAAVMTPGTELCRREDAERLYEQMKVEK